jgi:hypothetical protein
MGQGALGLHRKTLGREAPTAEDALNHLLLTLDVEQLYRSETLASQTPPPPLLQLPALNYETTAT